ncbi:GNAT family N-acetyltransferase [Nocardia stercoris]|uniref:N-acetyltransferase n=1 Tax=Nocardia stercoris TaxID=2483361 RepID=A0A3M2KSA6_9NOCA|nr:GNAT family protein [Nocardia stercoris]RMI28537.1 N-acetyltransferase [Nocardia stercoris]
MRPVSTDRFEPRPDTRPDESPWPAMRWPVEPGIELAGDTVTVRPLDPRADGPELFTALDHDRVWAHVPGRPGSVAEFVRNLEQRVAQPDWQLWTVRLRRPVAGLRAGSIAGMTAYLDVQVHNAALEVGYTVYRPEVWATAVNPETKRLLLGHAFEVLGAGRVQLKTDVRNHRSQQAIARLGAVYEGTLRRHFRRADGTVRDSVLFAVTVEDWPVVRAGLDARLAEQD